MVNKNENDKLDVKQHPKKKKNFEKPKIDVECPSFKQRSWNDFHQGFTVKIVNFS